MTLLEEPPRWMMIYVLRALLVMGAVIDDILARVRKLDDDWYFHMSCK